MGKPKIRFRGYTDDWEQRKLGEVFEQTSNLVNPKEDEIELWSLTVEDGLTKKSDRYNREFLVKKDDNFKEVRPGDIVYNPMNMTLGAVGYNDMAKSVAVSGYYTTMVTKENYDTYYINTWLKSPQAIQLYRTYATGSLIEKQRVQFPTLSIIPVAFPKYEEQTKIGSYFHSLDHLITLHQRKCEETKKLKKYMLQKMFPRNGQVVPEIRFSGFTDDWEQRKLLSCIQSITDFRGRTPKKLGMDWSESGYLALSALNVKDGYIDFSQDVHYGNQELYDKWMSGKELHRGQVLFTTEAPMGNVAQVPDNKGYILSQRTIAFDVEEEILSENFLATLLRTPNVFNDLTALSSGGTAKGVSQKSLSGLDVVIPKNIDEQNKLADYFINLDHLITLHQNKCDELKKIKKFMLQNMFV